MDDFTPYATSRAGLAEHMEESFNQCLERYYHSCTRLSKSLEVVVGSTTRETQLEKLLMDEQEQKSVREQERERADTKQHYVKIAVVLDAYELANVLRAIRTAPNDGDWYGQVLHKIDYALRGENFHLQESAGPTGPFNFWPQTFRVAPNTPYPEGFATKYNTYPGRDPLE